LDNKRLIQGGEHIAQTSTSVRRIAE